MSAGPDAAPLASAGLLLECDCPHGVPTSPVVFEYGDERATVRRCDACGARRSEPDVETGVDRELTGGSGGDLP